MTLDRKKFYSEIGPLKQEQVDGFETIIAAGYKLPLTHLAYVLATAMHETATAMQPIKETVMPHHKDKNPSDSTVIARLDKAFNDGRLRWVTKPYWRDGWFGRGYVQLTHKRNYEMASELVGVDLVASPNKAMHPEIAAKILVEGMARGMFTGKSMSDYLPGDYINARRVVNGLDRADEIAARAKRYERALSVAGYVPGVDKPSAPTGGFWTAVVTILKGLFK